MEQCADAVGTRRSNPGWLSGGGHLEAQSLPGPLRLLSSLPERGFRQIMFWIQCWQILLGLLRHPLMPDSPVLSTPALLYSHLSICVSTHHRAPFSRAGQGLSCSWFPPLAGCLAHCRCWITVCPINTHNVSSKFTSPGRSEVNLTLVFPPLGMCVLYSLVLTGFCSAPPHWDCRPCL